MTALDDKRHAALLRANLSRRTVLRAALAASMAGILAACGGDDDDANSAGTQPEATATASRGSSDGVEATVTAVPSDSGTRSYTDDAGRTVEIPARPERIVATHGRNAGALVLALGGPLVGIATRGGVVHTSITRYFDVDGIETVGEYSETDIEKVVALNPDVIVHQAADGQVSLDPPVLARLEEIAPVIGFNVFQPVDRVMAKVSELLGTSEAQATLEAQRAEYETALDALKAVLGDRWSEVTASSLFFWGRQGGVMGAGGPEINASNNILTSLGVSWTQLVMEAAEQGQLLGDISFERLNEFDGDLLLVSAFGDPDFSNLPLWDSLQAVQANQVISMPDDMIGTHYPNYIATVRFLADAIAGIDGFRTDLV